MAEPIPDPTLPRYPVIIPRPFNIETELRGRLPAAFHMDQFFGKVTQCGMGSSTPSDVTDVEFTSGYVVCTRYGLQVAVLEAEVIFNAATPAEAYRLKISDTYDPNYPVIDGISESYVDAADEWALFDTGPSGEKLYVSLALNWARDMTP